MQTSMLAEWLQDIAPAPVYDPYADCERMTDEEKAQIVNVRFTRNYRVLDKKTRAVPVQTQEVKRSKSKDPLMSRIDAVIAPNRVPVQNDRTDILAKAAFMRFLQSQG